MSVRILWQDEHLCVVDKPAGVATCAERWNPDADTVTTLLWEHWRREHQDAPRPFLVHRLDKGTSGVLVFARSAAAQAGLQAELATRAARKCYLALVSGTPERDEGRIECDLAEDPARRGAMRVVAKGAGKPTITEFEMVERFRSHSLLRVRPRTGRTHQIRVALRELGHPLTVDALYGDGRPILLSAFKRDYRPSHDRPERPLIDRLSLHAERLELRHPATQEALLWTSPTPRDLALVCKQLRRWAPPGTRPLSAAESGT